MAAPRISFALRTTAACFLVLALAVGRLEAVALRDFINDPDLTPKKFAAAFENFEYQYSPEVQPAKEFLASRRGDCDDYAILADHVLRPKGFDTRIIHIRLVGRVAHAVCYVVESKAYLDYNNRKYILNLQRSGRTLREIATKVADSFEANWTSVSEFTYSYEAGKKTFGRTVVKTEPRAKDADLQPN
jgi:transglutaminase-like putative cysteine protease